VADRDADHVQLRVELAHWREAVDALADLDAIAAPAAWAGLEEYLRMRVRDRLLASVAALSLEASEVSAALAGGAEQADHADVRRRLLALRQRYLQVETVLDFYGDAVNTRTNPVLAALLAGLDTIAADSLDVILRPLGIEPPLALVYLDKGLGASILRAGVRLWDHTSPSPVAAIKVTRHNLGHPTALPHETGHQVAHLTGWNAELADALDSLLAGRSRELAAVWGGWASEIAADVHAFVQAGWAPLPALAQVVDGPSPAVHRILWIRVALGAELCRRWYGAGPWDRLARVWRDRHPPTRNNGDGAAIAAASLPLLGEIADVCTSRPMAAFHGRALHELADPRRVSPAALDALARRAGPSLVTSQYLSRREPLRILAWLATRASLDPGDAAAHTARLRAWLSRLAAVPLARPA
jgi:hypothetical protein